MRAIAVLSCISIGCALVSREKTEEKKTVAGIPPVKITQFYATLPKMQPGDKELLCYGVENAESVWLSPPRQQLMPAMTRCIEVAPAATTEYRLTAEGTDGTRVFQDLEVIVGAPRAKIIEVRVNTLDAKRGETVSMCFRVANTKSLPIDPGNFKAGSGVYGCATFQPKETTTYVVTATGADGETDRERLTIKVH